jgi:hypothetical protein
MSLFLWPFVNFQRLLSFNLSFILKTTTISTLGSGFAGLVKVATRVCSFQFSVFRTEGSNARIRLLQAPTLSRMPEYEVTWLPSSPSDSLDPILCLLILSRCSIDADLRAEDWMTSAGGWGDDGYDARLPCGVRLRPFSANNICDWFVNTLVIHGKCWFLPPCITFVDGSLLSRCHSLGRNQALFSTTFYGCADFANLTSREPAKILANFIMLLSQFVCGLPL